MDNYELWKKHDERQTESIERLPMCSECKEKIQDEVCFEIDGELICESCMMENHRRYTDEFTG